MNNATTAGEVRAPRVRDPSLRALAALLAYPDAALMAALPDIRAALASDARIPGVVRGALGSLLDHFAGAPLLDAQERYVALFDRGRRTSLHLFEHVHGDSRDRGQAMVDLNARYEAAGLALAPGELPDYLPALLEYLCVRDDAEARDMVGDCAHLVRAIGQALAERGSTYAAALAAILAIAGEAGLDAAPVRGSEPGDDAASLDEAWAEPAVLFGPPCAGHPAQPAAQAIQFIRKVA